MRRQKSRRTKWPKVVSTAYSPHTGLAERPECPDVKNYKWRLNPVWHRMLYSCTDMATVGVKVLKFVFLTFLRALFSVRRSDGGGWRCCQYCEVGGCSHSGMARGLFHLLEVSRTSCQPRSFLVDRSTLLWTASRRDCSAEVLCLRRG